MARGPGRALAKLREFLPKYPDIKLELSREPSRPQDLVRHRCITERHVTSGGIWAWEGKSKSVSTASLSSTTLTTLPTPPLMVSRPCLRRRWTCRQLNRSRRLIRNPSPSRALTCRNGIPTPPAIPEPDLARLPGGLSLGIAPEPEISPAMNLAVPGQRLSRLSSTVK